ncbi:MAG TPA: heavy-metal-associated domain-containing protein [Alphaproteobacteria bacterium]
MFKQILTIALLSTAIITPVFAADKTPVVKPVLTKTIHIGVNGMVCDFCAQSLKKVFGKQKGVETVAISLEKKLITLTVAPDTKLDDATITKLVTDSGYAVEKISRL